VLGELGAAERPMLRVLNQVDRLEPARVRGLADSDPHAVAVSAKTGAGLDRLRERMAEQLGLTLRAVSLRFEVGEQREVAELYRSGRVRSHEIVGNEVHIAADVPAWLAERYRERGL
jgi:GTP-binding protein HflX